MDSETSIGGSSRFEETNCGWFEQLRSPDSHVVAKAVESVLEQYWKPIYKRFRLKWNKTNADAKEMTQAFCISLLDGKTLARFDREKSSFRNYLKVCADRFATNVDRDQKRIKRGGGLASVALDFDVAESELGEFGVILDDTVDHFQIEWLRSVLELAGKELRERLEAQGKRQVFDVFHARDIAPLDDEEVPGYATLAGQFSISESQVRNFLTAARREFRAILECKMKRFEFGQ